MLPNISQLSLKLQDRHGLGSYLPPEDTSQDWLLLDAHEADGWTTIKFTRGFYPCDQEEDIQLTVRFTTLKNSVSHRIKNPNFPERHAESNFLGGRHG